MDEGERVRGLKQSGFCKINTVSVADYKVAQSPTRAEILCVGVCVRARTSSRKMWAPAEIMLKTCIGFFLLK